MKAVLRWVTALTVLAAVPPGAARGASEDPEAVLGRIRAAQENLRGLKAAFVHTKSVPLFEETITSKGELYFRGPDRLLLQYTEPDSNRVVIGDGHVWLYYPALRQAHRYDIDPESTLPGLFLALRGDIEGLHENFDVSAEEGEERASGAPTDRLLLHPKEGSDLAGEIDEIVIVLRRDTAFPVRTEFHENGGDLTTFTFRDFVRNPGLSDDFFVFRPPPGTEVFELEGETW